MPRLMKGAILVASAALLASAAFAGPVADFEQAMRSAYADYRAALFQTNAKDPAGSAKAIGAFKSKWTALASANAKAPPQYADDAAYAATMAKVVTITDAAAAQVTAGKLAEAHETLEGIREEIAGLHERNGVIGFSDRMNAYHAKMEEVLDRNYQGFNAAGLAALHADAAVLDYLAADIAAHPPKEASDPAFKTLLDGVTASVVALKEAKDAAAAQSAVDNLKMPYSKFFLKFG